MRKTFFGIFGALAFIAACGGTSEPPALGTPYTPEQDRTVVVGDGKGGATYVTPNGTECLQIGNECIRPQDKCGDNARADVIVDSQGRVVEIVCYPVTSPTPVEGKDGTDLGKGNKDVVAVDGADDGVDITGDVKADGNNVTIYGQGADVSIIGGSVDVPKNNFSARGVRIKGNVTIEGNNATFVLCVINGDVTIRGNNTVLAECTVFGKVTITGNNSKLVGNGLKSGISNGGQNTVCDGNVSFVDANGDGKVVASELGAPLSCSP
jgi:hypothetical protein